MKKNLPITDREISLPTGEELISTTDLKGIITSYNSAFLSVSGFDDVELINKNHNVIRHPDMPVEAFDDLWTHMKADKHWMGIVKNRAKNGDYYWVDAYVTPMIEDDQTIGYESVRAVPSKDKVARAEEVYKQLRAGNKPKLGSFLDRLCLRCRVNLLNIVSVLLGGLTYLIIPEVIPGLAIVSAAIVVLITFLFGIKWAFSPLDQAVETVKKDINNPLMSMIYTGRSDEIGQIQLPAELLKAKLRTVLVRIKDAADKIQNSSAESVAGLNEINKAVSEQASETDLVATAMTEMTASVQEVASNAAYAANKAEDVDSHSQQGVAHASGAADGLQGLNTAVENISKVVTRLNDDTQNIGMVVDVIKNIAEQTNLLALNAAIEAARAGEQGRGFAVVADEVRTLAGRTQESTQEIQALIENLNEAVSHAVTVVEVSQRSALDSEEKVTSAIESLGSIAKQVSEMNDMNMQIATAVEEQSSVSTDMNRNIVQIRDGAGHVLSAAGSINTAAQDLSTEANELSNMIKRFKQA